MEKEKNMITGMNPVALSLIYVVVILLTLSCLLPLINMIAISFSGSEIGRAHV